MGQARSADSPSPFPTSGYFRLQSQFIPISDSSLLERLIVEQLHASAPMMKLVAHQLAVGAIQREVHAFNKDNEKSVYSNVTRGLDLVNAAAGNI